MKRTLEEAEDRIDALEEALLKVRQWCDSYPEHIFRPLTDDEIRRAVDAMCEAIGGAGSDRMHASWARHILAGMREHTNVLDQS